MQPTTLFLAASTALVAGAADGAAIQQQRDGARLAQFRVWGASGCGELNQGYFKVEESDVGACHNLTAYVPRPGARSAMLEQLYYPAAEGCSLGIFTDETCSGGRRALLSLHACEDAPVEEGSGTWGSWQVLCNEPGDA
ncbi:hypothetical protein DL766_009265 [Monosporascus sp. MC13-8B]|nr:hypothetical protein DL763_008815 [Monosporascus cannonballus]RYP15948.1 hypothetical protein DL766_009265 [Monosporascus sp. MC13-8B]